MYKRLLTALVLSLSTSQAYAYNCSSDEDCSVGEICQSEPEAPALRDCVDVGDCVSTSQCGVMEECRIYSFYRRRCELTYVPNPPAADGLPGIPITLPVVSPPIPDGSVSPGFHERLLYDWSPVFDVNIPAFDQNHGAHIRARGDAKDQVNSPAVLGGELRVPRVPDRMERIEASATVTSAPYFQALIDAYPGAASILQTRQADGRTNAQVVFDRRGSAYSLISVYLLSDSGGNLGAKIAILRSSDNAQTWKAIPVPPPGELGLSYSSNTWEGWAAETPDSGDPLEGAPVLLLWKKKGATGLCQNGAYDVYGDLYAVRTIDDGQGGLSFSSPVLLSSTALGFSQHSGGATMVVTRGDRSFVTWSEAVLPGASPSGVDGAPVLVADVDWLTSSVSQKKSIGFSSPYNDTHNTPALLVDRQGYIHVVSGAHQGDFRYQKSTSPLSISAWTQAQPTIANPTTTCTRTWTKCSGAAADNTSPQACQTYISVVRDSKDTLHLVFRQIRSMAQHYGGESVYVMAYQNKPYDAPWSSAKVLYVPPLPGYARYNHKVAVDHSDRLYVLYSYFPDPALTTGYTGLGRLTYSALIATSDEGATWRLVDEEYLSQDLKQTISIWTATVL